MEESHPTGLARCGPTPQSATASASSLYCSPYARQITDCMSCNKEILPENVRLPRFLMLHTNPVLVVYGKGVCRSSQRTNARYVREGSGARTVALAPFQKYKKPVLPPPFLGLLYGHFR
jgi:hypothetical protein